MKVLICGLGSIGQRHVRILQKILGHEAEIGVVRFRKRAIVINDDMTAVAHYGLVDYASYDEAFKAGQQVVFVTNPISMHVDTALRAARNDCHLFIEKPLSHDLNGVTALCEEVKQRHLTASVGCQLRFHPMLEQVRNLIREGAIGDVISADVHFGEWLPGMHPYEIIARVMRLGRIRVAGSFSHSVTRSISLHGSSACVRVWQRPAAV
jgi:predicted dehydrogenase